MKTISIYAIVLVSALLLCDSAVLGGRGRGGGFGGGGFGPGGGGFGGGGAVIKSYGGGGAGSFSSKPIVGPAGGSGGAGKVGGSYTTKGGSTIDYKGAGVGGTTPGGVQGGKYIGGVQVTGPGGKQATKVGTGGAVSGPGGTTIGGKQGLVAGSGPQGAIAGKYQGGVAIGPQGGAAVKSKSGIATGPGGTVIGGSKSGIASGPYGAVGGKTTVVAGNKGTYFRSTAAIHGQGVFVRHAVVNYPCFRPGWYTQNPGAWFAAGWVANSVWRAATWASCAPYCGTSDAPVYYNYGDNVVYEDDGVYFNGEKAYPLEDYSQGATTLAETGQKAKVAKDEDWLPLGVFAMVQGDEKTSNHIFQLAINKKGVLRGNYYDAVMDSTSEIYGAVDKETQRAAWTVGDRKTPVYEAGIANLTKDETTMVVHYGKDRSQQFMLIRIEEPEKK